VAGLVSAEMPRRHPVGEAVLGCLALSYRAEVRPEGPQKVRALYESFSDYYDARFAPLLINAAARRGIRHDPAVGLFIDERDERVRQKERAEVLRILRKSRLRAVLRWPKQALVYRGWLTYVIDKRRRARQLESQSWSTL
jgi:hypothetical protein